MNIKNKKIDIIAFTDNGCLLGLKLKEMMKCSASFTYGCGENKVSGRQWVAEKFDVSDLLVIIGSTGIAVRLIAKYVDSKKKDPAVLVIDDRGINCISLLSGHIGGANDYCRWIAELISANAVITTATDINNCFSIDTWASKHNCSVINIDRIKNVSSKSLRKEGIGMAFNSEELVKYFKQDSDLDDANLFYMNDAMIRHAELDVYVSYKKSSRNDLLKICPKVISLGIGCRKNTTYEDLRFLFDECLNKLNIYEEAVYCISTIDIKKDEAAILKLVENLRCDFHVFTADELNEVSGSYTESEFVRKITGCASVSERSAVRGLFEIPMNSEKVSKIHDFDIASEKIIKKYDDTNIILRKTARNGVTVSLACVFDEESI